MREMITFTVAILLLLVSLVGVTLEKTIFYLPARELQRRAERGDGIAARLYRAAVYDGELRLLLALVSLLTAAAGVLLFAIVAPWPLGLVVVALALGLDFFWQQRVRLTAVEARLAAFIAPGLAWLMSKLQPATGPAIQQLRRVYTSRRHTGLFERLDLIELLDRQLRQRDNRINHAELERLKGVLQLDDLTVKDLMTPRKQVVTVAATEPISPILIDELHQTGHRYFPVYGEDKTNIVGVLELARIANVRQHGSVGDSADQHLVFVHEWDHLARALRAFYETGQPLFIVVDQHSNYSGILTINDVLRKLVGALDEEAFGKFDDREAVAARHPKSG